jgi:hypothetical protein
MAGRGKAWRRKRPTERREPAHSQTGYLILILGDGRVWERIELTGRGGYVGQDRAMRYGYGRGVVGMGSIVGYSVGII